METAESSTEIKYRKIVYTGADRLFFSDIKDYNELRLSFLCNNNFGELKALLKTSLKRVFYFEYEKRREILNNKLLFIKYHNKVNNGR